MNSASVFLKLLPAHLRLLSVKTSCNAVRESHLPACLKRRASEAQKEEFELVWGAFGVPIFAERAPTAPEVPEASGAPAGACVSGACGRPEKYPARGKQK